MKKITFALFVLLLMCNMTQKASAQAEASGVDGQHFSIGPIFTFGVSTFAGEVPDSYKIKPRTSLTFGALAEVDISPAISFNLGLQYETRGRYWYKEADKENFNYEAELSYFTISPLFNFRHVLLGLGIRLPMAGTLITNDGGVKGNRELPYTSLSTGEVEMTTPIEIKLGGNIEILETRGGTLNFIILAGYDLSPAFKTIAEPLFNPGQPEGSLHLGLNYLFNAATMK